jgi:hypothetical protein
MRRLAAVVCMLAALGAATPARAADPPANMFVGDPWVGSDLEMRVGAGGRPKRILLGFHQTCDKIDPDDPADRYKYQGGGKTVLRPVLSSPRRFTAVKRFRIRFREHDYVQVRLHVEGVRVSRKRWKGTYRAFSRVYELGERDTCRSGRRKWAAVRRSRFRFEVAGISGDYVTRGQAWSYSSPRYHAWVWGEKAQRPYWLMFSSNRYPDGEEDWDVEFRLPYGQRLEPGRTYKDEHWYPQDKDFPNISMGGLYHGCADETGEFTIHELAYNKRGYVRRLRASFTHYCESSAPSHGTIDYTL